MTVRELLAMFGVKDPETLSEFQTRLSEALKTIAGWGESAREWYEHLDPSTREFMASFAKAQNESTSEEGTSATWWSAPPTVSVPRKIPSADPAVKAEMDAMKARISELEERFKKATGRAVPDAFPPKKNESDPN